MRAALKFVAVQAGWFACVLGAAHGSVWLGPVVVAAVLAVAVTLSARPLAQLAVALGSGVLGIFVESALRGAGLASYPDSSQDALAVAATWLAPTWMAALWVNFSTVAGELEGLFRGRRLWLAAGLGVVFGPLTYAGGARLGAINVTAGGHVALAAIWGVVTPGLACAGRLVRRDGRRARSTTEVGIR